MTFEKTATAGPRRTTVFVKAALAASLALAFTSHVYAASTATTTATFEVTAINEIGLNGTAPSLTVSTATAGAAPDAATASQTYAVTTNQTAKISAAIDSNMPSGLVLTASMAAPTGATSANAQVLSTVGQDLVTAITGLNESGLLLSYSLTATAAAGVVTSSTRTVTYTITGS